MKYLALTILSIFCFLQTASSQRTCPRVDEYYRGRHKINGMHYGHPYTTFDRKNGDSFSTTVDKIRMQISYEANPDVRGPIYLLYAALYNHANKPNPVAETAGDGIIYRDVNLKPADVSSVPTWAKNNALVFLVGLNIQMAYAGFM